MLVFRSAKPKRLPHFTFASTSVVPQAMRGVSVDRDPISDELSSTYKRMEDARVRVDRAQGKVAIRVANRVDDLYDRAKAGVEITQNVASSAEAVYEMDAMKTVRDGIRSLVESLPAVLKALDEVAAIHPFLKIAVGAFRVVVELDKKRRDNEKKITLMFVEMKDMMEVLVQLRSIEDSDAPGFDGVTIKARLQRLVNLSAEDIKECANTCDAYSKERLLAKVLKSSSWDDKFKTFLTLFADRRKAFTFALGMHIGKAVDDASRKLDSVDAKLDVVLAIFSALVTPDQQQLESIIESKGGIQSVLGDDTILAGLLTYKSPNLPSGTEATLQIAGLQEVLQLRKDRMIEVGTVREQLSDTIEAVVGKNLETFERKFTIQERRVAEEMESIVRNESDRVIESVLTGPHTRIQEHIIREVWMEMRWRGHVKAREFILALRDFYMHQIEQGNVDSDDKWALECLNVNYVSSISEAFDDDASGFLTIDEVNNFARLRPQGWSMLHWIAYWARGWRMTCIYYIDKINKIMDQMHILLPHIRKENRESATWYHVTSWQVIAAVTASFNTVEESFDDVLWERFRDYVESEENRLEESLKTARYYVDATDTLSLITGPGRIERFLLPVLYLLVRRDYQILRLSHQKVIIHHQEIHRCAVSIAASVLDAMLARVGALDAVFKQRNLDPEKQFKTFAYGMYYYTYKPDQLWSLQKRMAPGNTDFTTIDLEYSEEEMENVRTLPDPDHVLNFLSPREGFMTMDVDAATERDTKETNDLNKNIVGRWYGFFGRNGSWPAFPMDTFFLHASGTIAFEAESRTAPGRSFTIAGQINARADGVVECMSQWRFSNTAHTRLLKGLVSEDGLSISGTWAETEDKLAGSFDEFHFTRLSPDILTVRPSPLYLRENRINALWRFALDATRLQVRRRTASWTYIVDLLQRCSHYLQRYRWRSGWQNDTDLLPLDIEKDLAPHTLTFTFHEACFLYILLEMRRREYTSMMSVSLGSCLVSSLELSADTIIVPSHSYSYFCDFCGRIHALTEPRYTCITCSIPSDTTVDFCDCPRCRDASCTLARAVHRGPTHDMLKIRALIIWQRDLARLCGLAKGILARTQEMFKAGVGCVPRGAGGTKPAPACVSCAAEVHLPFFVCLDCAENDDDVYICAACDENIGGVSADDHKPHHTLVRCLPLEIRESSGGSERMEERLRELETKVASYSDRMTRIEQLLEGMSTTLARLVPQQVPAGPTSINSED
ncbi:hypothetical protein BC628DRAFT_1501118 [Trametes gibbosa]|nr:hypothetical protein BC628DRAFT_1501118 [Trametes gibbosa]